MTIRKKLILSFTATAAGVAGVGAIGVDAAMRASAELARLQSPTARDLSRTLEVLVYVTPVAVILSLGLGMILARTLAKRLGRFSIQDGQEGLLPTTSGDEFDDLAGVFNDLTGTVKTLRERAVSEEQLAAARRYADNIIHSMFDVLIVTDPNLNITTVNKAACSLLEYTELELVGHPVEMLFKEEPMMLATPVREILRNSTTRDNEMTYLTRSGRQVSALVSVSVMRDTAGRPLAIITVGKDITARKQIERDLIEAKAAAEASSRAKSAFVANMSHEIRTPMTAILGYADLMTFPNQPDTERQNCLDTIRRNGQHLLAIINDILDVSKIEAGRMSVERIACSPTQIVSDVAALMSIRAQGKSLGFDVRYTGPIPHSIHSDPTRLRQVLVNLLGNAIKFTSRGGVKLLVGMAEQPPGTPPRLRFDVVDSGVGLTKAQQESLFRAFVQADTSHTRRFGGTGLGLAISKKMSEMLGGDIAVRSVPGHGSTFTVTVETGDLSNVAMIENPSAVVSEAAGAKWDSSRQLRGHVLVAEDGPDNRVLITFYLKHAGLDVTVVENGLLARDAALAAVKAKTPFDLILMDMQMPELDGYGATSELRAAGYTGPIVALTAHALGGDRDKCLAAGCNDMSGKPIDHDKLLEVVGRYTREAAAGETKVNPTIDNPGVIERMGSHVETLMAKPKMARLVERFVAGLGDRVGAIEKAVGENDRQKLKVLAHQLKGAAGGYGFPQIGSLAAALEASAEMEIEALNAQVRELANLCEEAGKQTQVTKVA